MKKYIARTSSGKVFVEVNEDSFNTNEAESWYEDFKIENEEFLRVLYNEYCGADIIENNKGVFLIIDVSNIFYGAVEYYLEEVK